MNRCAVCICESGRFASCDPVPTACGARWVRWIRVGKFENIPKTGIPIKALVKGHKALGLCDGLALAIDNSAAWACGAQPAK